MERSKTSDTTKAFENAIADRKPAQRYVLRLYVTGNTIRSVRAIQNIRSICDERLPGMYELEVIDIYQRPGEIAADQIVVTPTLVKVLPPPLRRIIGDLSNVDRVLVGLDLYPSGPLE